MERIVIVGAGQAGHSMAERLRALGHGGRLTLLGEEPVPPYQRPPLSKAYLLGEMERARLFLRGTEFYADQEIELRTGTRVAAIDRARREVALDGGERLPYDALALTTGAVPRTLPAAIGGALEGVHLIRTLADIDAMAPAFRPGARALIVGGGYIGLEAAAAAAKTGLGVTLIEAAGRILGRVACAETADVIRAAHLDQGVDLREGVGVARLAGAGGRVTGAELSDGTRVDADLVIIGIGIRPATELAEAAGLDIEDGIRVDAAGRTSDPAIFAAGDCACFPLHGRRIRLESVQNAVDQAGSVAAGILGRGAAYAPVPWFWSDQYDLKLQIAGLGHGHDMIVRRAGAREGAVSHWYFAGADLLAVDAVNDPRAYMAGRSFLEKGIAVTPDMIADPGTHLRELMQG